MGGRQIREPEDRLVAQGMVLVAYLVKGTLEFDVISLPLLSMPEPYGYLSYYKNISTFFVILFLLTSILSGLSCHNAKTRPALSKSISAYFSR